MRAEGDQFIRFMRVAHATLACTAGSERGVRKRAEEVTRLTPTLQRNPSSPVIVGLRPLSPTYLYGLLTKPLVPYHRGLPWNMQFKSFRTVISFITQVNV